MGPIGTLEQLMAAARERAVPLFACFACANIAFWLGFPGNLPRTAEDMLDLAYVLFAGGPALWFAWRARPLIRSLMTEPRQ